MERREEVYGSQSQAAPSHAAPPGAGRFPVEVALAEDAGGQSEPLDPPQNFHGMTSAAELARIEAETVLINILKPYNEDKKRYHIHFAYQALSFFDLSDPPPFFLLVLF